MNHYRRQRRFDKPPARFFDAEISRRAHDLTLQISTLRARPFQTAESKGQRVSAARCPVGGAVYRRVWHSVRQAVRFGNEVHEDHVVRPRRRGSAGRLRYYDTLTSRLTSYYTRRFSFLSIGRALGTAPNTHPQLRRRRGNFPPHLNIAYATFSPFAFRNIEIPPPQFRGSDPPMVG